MTDNDNPMTADELWAIKRALGVSFADMAEAIGWGRKSGDNLRKACLGSKVLSAETAQKLRALRR